MTDQAGRQTTPEEFQAQHGHPGEVCRVGEYDGKQTTCVQSWERAAGGREATPPNQPDTINGVPVSTTGTWWPKTPPARETP